MSTDLLTNYFIGLITFAMKQVQTHILKEVFRRAGNKNQLAKALDVSRQYVSAWTKVPIVHLTKVSEITGIPKKILRPDIYD